MNFARKLAVAAALATTLGACRDPKQDTPSKASSSPVMPREIPEIDPMVRFPIHPPAQKLEGPAQNKAIVFGGNCEGRKDRANMFFDSFTSLAGKLTRHGWNPDVFYSAKATEPAAAYETLSRAVGNHGQLAVGEGTLENLFAALDSAMALPRDSQLLLVVLTHGGPAVESHAHTWCATYTVSETGERKTVGMTMNFAPFFKRLEVLRREGVRIGIVDASCYSGGAVETLSWHACVVSGQAQNRYARGHGITQALEQILDRTNAPRLPSLDHVFLAALAEARTNEVNQPAVTGFMNKNDISESITRWLSRYDSSDVDSAFWNEQYDAAFPPAGDDLENIQAYLLRPRSEPPVEDRALLASLWGDGVYELQTHTRLEDALKDLRRREASDRTRFADASAEQLFVELKTLMEELRETRLEIHFRLPSALQRGAYRNLRLESLKEQLDIWVYDSGLTLHRVVRDEIVFHQTAMNAYADLIFGTPADWQKRDTRDYMARFGLVSVALAEFPYQRVAERLPVPSGLSLGEVTAAQTQLVAALSASRDAAVLKLDPSVKQKIDRYLEISQKLRGYVRSAEAIRFNRMQKVSLRLRAIDFLNWKREQLKPAHASSEAARQFQQCLDFKFEKRAESAKKDAKPDALPEVDPLNPIGG